MRDYIVDRVKQCARYVLETGATVRACAGHFRISKTTVHKDLCGRLPRINPHLAKEVKGVLESNKAQRHLRGGMATHQKYKGNEGASR